MKHVSIRTQNYTINFMSDMNFHSDTQNILYISDFKLTFYLLYKQTFFKLKFLLYKQIFFELKVERAFKSWL